MSEDDLSSGGGHGGSIVLGAVSFVVGALLAVGTLMGQSVREVSQYPEAEQREPGQVYFVRGSLSGGDLYERKLEQLVTGSVSNMRVTEGECNRWGRAYLQVEEGSGSWVSKWLVEDAEPVQFRVEDGYLWLGTEVTLASWTGNKQLKVQGRGVFEENLRGEVTFRLVEGHVGRAPLGHVPLVRSLIYGQLKSFYRETEGWDQLMETRPLIRSVEAAGEEGLRIRLGTGN